MKTLILLATLLSVNAFAGITPEQKKEACETVRKIVPTENGRGISLKACLKTFSFEKTFESPALITIRMVGQTVDDVTTICTANLKVNFGYEVTPAAPNCELQ